MRDSPPRRPCRLAEDGAAAEDCVRLPALDSIWRRHIAQQQQLVDMSHSYDEVI